MTDAGKFLFLYSFEGRRAWEACATEEAAALHVIELFEETQMGKMREASSDGKIADAFQYDASSLLDFVDVKLSHIIVLHQCDEERHYETFGATWLKNRINAYLKASVVDASKPNKSSASTPALLSPKAQSPKSETLKRPAPR